MRVEISVTAADIARGIRSDCSRCPVVHALLRAFPAADRATVNFVLTVFLAGSIIAQSYSPYAVLDWIDRFDRDESVAPFAFTADFT